MADRIGVARKWIQNPGTAREHFDIAKSKRALAVKFGAEEITMLEMGRLSYGRRSNNNYKGEENGEQETDPSSRGHSRRV